MPVNNFEVEYAEDGRIVDFLSGSLLETKPEEIVRQQFLRVLHFEYNYPKNMMRREVPIQHGSGELVDASGSPVRADIVIYSSASACSARDQGRIFLLVECKSPTETGGYNQLVSYIYNTSATGGVWYNGSGGNDDTAYYKRQSAPNNDLLPWIGIPRFNESWDALGRRSKSQLLRPKDIKGLLRRCHNKLHGRGHEGEEEDLTMDMVRIVLAKAMDEEAEGELPDFYCSAEEYNTEEGRQVASRRVEVLFDKAKQENSDVFSQHERITVSPRAICDVVVELQPYQLLSDLSSSDDWDIMGLAYEQYTSAYLKRQQGQFFTNRLVVNFVISALDPVYTDRILDPAGGSGGFLTGALRHVRLKILNSNATPVAKQRQLEGFRKRLFLVDTSKRLVKVAKTAMILNGDGHTGMTQGDSLGDFSKFHPMIVAHANKGEPTIIVTNPPFAGVGEGRVSDRETLERFNAAKRWIEKDNKYQPTDEILPDGVPPELLFFERCVEWLAPGGKLGIVLPKSFLDTATYQPGRSILFEKCQLLAVVNCHKHTFQPHTGVRTCLLLIRKLAVDELSPVDYDIFMAISRKIGQDSEGVPIYKRDDQNRILEVIDHDFDDILQAYKNFTSSSLIESEYTFSTSKSSLDAQLRINPQAFLPALNKTLRQVAEMDGVEGWTVTPLGQISDDIKIFKGPRFSSESIIVDGSHIAGAEPYYTPSAILQEKADSVKWILANRATRSQLRTISAIRVAKGDILVTRSGSIGRLAYITKAFDKAIVSDDMIRVRIKSEELRCYVYFFLQTKFAQDQMLRNEYGAVQQHLEPQHVRDILVPLPDDFSKVNHVIDAIKRTIEQKEALQELVATTTSLIDSTLDALVQASEITSEAKDQ